MLCQSTYWYLHQNKFTYSVTQKNLIFWDIHNSQRKKSQKFEISTTLNAKIWDFLRYPQGPSQKITKIWDIHTYNEFVVNDRKSCSEIYGLYFATTFWFYNMFFWGGTVIAILAILQGILFTLLCMLVMRGYCYRR